MKCEEECRVNVNVNVVRHIYKATTQHIHTVTYSGSPLLLLWDMRNNNTHNTYHGQVTHYELQIINDCCHNNIINH